MTTIAHLSDLHLDGTLARHESFVRALEDAWSYQPDHLVITGDVTADGKPHHRDELHNTLTGWPTPTTIIAGNHDKNLSFTSQITDFGDSLLIPVDTRATYRPYLFRALGRIGGTQLDSIDRLTQDESRPAILAMHHGPQIHSLHVFDGLIDRARLQTLLINRPWVHVVCGHDHRCLDFGRIHVAPSVANHPDPVRIYRIMGHDFVPTYQSQFTGMYFT